MYGLMKETGYSKYYDGIYGGLSFEVHGFNAAMSISVNKNELSLKWIRNPENGSVTFDLACAMSVGVLYKIYQYLRYGDDEMMKFKSYFENYEKNRDCASRALGMIEVTSKSNSK